MDKLGFDEVTRKAKADCNERRELAQTPGDCKTVLSSDRTHERSSEATSECAFRVERKDTVGSLFTKGGMTDGTDSATARMSSERSEVRMGTAGVAEKAGVAGEIVKISDICVINPRMPELDEQMNISFVPMQSVGEDGSIDPSEIRRVSEVKKGFTSFQEEDVLFAKITPCMENGKGAVAMNLQNNIGFGSTEFHVLRPNQDRVLPQWLFYLTHWSSFRKLCERNMTGSAGQKRVPKAFLEKYEITLPILEIQNYQVSVLSKIDQLISVRKKELEQLDTLIKARFVEMFGDPIRNDKGWETDTIIRLCEAIYGGGTPSKSHPEYFEGEIPWVSPKDMKADTITDSIDHITQEAVENSSAKMVPAGAVLMVIRSGILKHTLPVAIAKVELTVNQDMKVFVTKDTLLPEYLMFYFKAIEADVLSGVRSVTADNIDFKEFQNRQMIVPPIELQQQFATFVAQVDKSKLLDFTEQKNDSGGGDVS